MIDFGVLNTLGEAMEVLHGVKLADFRRAPVGGPDYQEGFGVWFRGHADASWPLTPSVFRSGPASAPFLYDETSVFHHFQIRLPEQHAAHRTDFDWLCLMQHYGLPTRLLDWSESILVALFFAVESQAHLGHDGRLFFLNGRRLNQLSLLEPRHGTSNLCTPFSVNTALRAEMAACRDVEAWQARLAATTIGYDPDRIKKLLEIVESNPSRLATNLATPVAVLPSRLNGRIMLQQGTFTLHGGKLYPSADPAHLPNPISLETADGLMSDAVLAYCTIPAAAKPRFRTELLTLGLHTASLFPELEAQAKYVAEQWRFPLPHSTAAVP